MSRRIYLRRSSRGVQLAVFVLVCALGCGKNSSLTKQVRGQVTFQGAAPPAEGQITFAPIEGAPTYPRRPASGDFDKTGTFTLTTFTKDDGIIPGKYRVNINCWREAPTLKTKLSANYVPADFKFEVTIDENADEPVEVRIDVPKIQRGR
jgi:hypothetical protein